MAHTAQGAPPGGGFAVELVVEGIVDRRWRERFANLEFSYVETATAGLTVMTGAVEDQAQLHAVLHAVRDLGLTLVSLRQHHE